MRTNALALLLEALADDADANVRRAAVHEVAGTDAWGHPILWATATGGRRAHMRHNVRPVAAHTNTRGWWGVTCPRLGFGCS